MNRCSDGEHRPARFPNNVTVPRLCSADFIRLVRDRFQKSHNEAGNSPAFSIREISARGYWQKCHSREQSSSSHDPAIDPAGRCVISPDTRSKIGCGTLILILIACATGLALGTDFVRFGANAETHEATLAVATLAPAFSISRDRRPMQPLSDEERAEVFDHLMRTPGVPVAGVDPPVEGAAIQASVDLQDLPTGVAQAIPRVEGTSSSSSRTAFCWCTRARKVVAEMPRYKLVLQ